MFAPGSLAEISGTSGDVTQKFRSGCRLPEQFFEEVLGSSHIINSTGNLWGIQRDEEQTYFLGGAQRYTGEQGATALDYDKESGWFEVKSEFALNFPLVVNSEKRRNAWTSFPSTFTYTEARNAAKPYMKSEGSFIPFWNELKRKKLLLSDDGVHYQKANELGRLGPAQVLADVRP